MSMSVKLLTKHHLEFLSLKGGCTGLSKSIHVKMLHCWKTHVAAHIKNYIGPVKGIFKEHSGSVGRVLDWGSKGC